MGRSVRARARGQTTVEAAISLLVVAVLFAMVLTLAWWGHAQGVVTAAVQDGARAASARGGDTARGLAIARQLLQAGLGTSAGLIDVSVDEDAQQVTFTAHGRWPVVAGPGVQVALPLGAEARVHRELWQP